MTNRFNFSRANLIAISYSVYFRTVSPGEIEAPTLSVFAIRPFPSMQSYDTLATGSTISKRFSFRNFTERVGFTSRSSLLSGRTRHSSVQQPEPSLWTEIDKPSELDTLSVTSLSIPTSLVLWHRQNVSIKSHLEFDFKFQFTIRTSVISFVEMGDKMLGGLTCV